MKAERDRIDASRIQVSLCWTDYTVSVSRHTLIKISIEFVKLRTLISLHADICCPAYPRSRIGTDSCSIARHAIVGCRRNYAPHCGCQMSTNNGCGGGRGTRATAEVEIDATTGNVLSVTQRADVITQAVQLSKHKS
jgi:hypothetical protein